MDTLAGDSGHRRPGDSEGDTRMRIAIYGATGMIGSRLAAEALARGHEVTGVSRSGGDLPSAARAVRGDAGDTGLAKRIAGEAAVVVSAIGPSRTGGDRREY